MLKEIIAAKRDAVRSLRVSAETPPLPRLSFREALSAGATPRIIAEIKKASPSKGIIQPDFDPPAIAAEYRAGGAAALSVLTDERFFQGSVSDLQRAKEAAQLPTLCKDFILDPAQVGWARSIGADAILLIVRILEDGQFSELLAAAREAGLDVVTETHTAGEIERALEAECDIIGVNNRDLDTFAVSLETALDLAPRLPRDVIKVAESGIETHADVAALTAVGYTTILVGETLMRASDRAGALAALRGERR